MGLTVSDAVKQLLKVVKQLQSTYPHRKFTLDGRLVGDIGEILVEENYHINLFKRLQKHHDGITPDGKQVQIKTTMQDSLTFPADHIPDYYLGIKINTDGTFKEVFNGPGSVAWAAAGKMQKNGQRRISLSSLSTSLSSLNMYIAASWIPQSW